MAAPSLVFTISYVAKMLGESEERLEELALKNLEPEDGCLGVIDRMESGGDELIAVTAFTTGGIEALKDLINDERRRR